jgi:glycosyltransferase involved in cell wall biosynthesis
MIYLTYNDQPSGVYSSQVSDVCNYLNKEFHANIRLVAFISLHSFNENRKKIKKEFPSAWILPALPKAKYWKFTMLIFPLICLLSGQKKIIARNVIAARIALFAKKTGFVKTVVLDGRGAIAAEWNEYQVVPDERMKKMIYSQEQGAVIESDFRIAVSSRLINYWKDAYGYNQSRHVVIPCTLNSGFTASSFSTSELQEIRSGMGFSEKDVIMVYSGSTAGWQSFTTLAGILGNVLKSGSHYKLLFLSGEDENINSMKKLFPGQVYNKWLKHHEVQKVLAACDYGILFRENSVTNQVASPTKFAEYLSVGLPVIISENLGDYTDFVRKEKSGMVIGPGDTITLSPVTAADKQRMIRLATDHFTKQANRSQYEILINYLNNN